MSTNEKMMIIGIGWIGGFMLEFLARMPGIPEIIIADKNEDLALGNVYSSQADIGIGNMYSAQGGAAQLDLYPQIEFVCLDLNNIEGTTDTLKRVKPDVIINCATLGAPRNARMELPKDVYEKLMEAGFGMWLPMHFPLSYKLMKAIRNANISPHVVSAPFPDLVNPVLGKVGLAPTVGFGNVDNSVPGIKKSVAERLNVPMKEISISVICHHAIRPIFLMKGIVRGLPYLLKIFVKGKDVTSQFDTDKLLSEVRIAPGIVASGGIRNALALLNGANSLVNAPGPSGLPGAYPVRLSKKGAKVELPNGITIEEAIKINEQGQELDGVEGIQDNGTVIYTKKATKIMKDVLDYECKELKIADSEDKAMELRSLYNRLKARYQ